MGGAWSAFGGTLTLTNGEHTMSLKTADAAGWTASTDQTVKVDTTAPTLDASVSGSTADGSWYSSAVTLTASGADDASGSGLNRVEYQDNGAAWTVYTAPVVFRSGKHTVQVRAVDNAGLISEEKAFDFQIDSRGPFIDFPSDWQAGQTAELKVSSNLNPLESVQTAISDPKARWPEVDHSYSAAGGSFTTELSWDGQFANGTAAPAGSYTVTITAYDDEGNPSVLKSTVTVAGAGTSAIVVQTPTELVQTPTGTENSTPTAGVTEIVEATATPRTTLSATSTTSGSTSFISPTPTTAATSGTPLSSNVLWGEAAAAVIGAATAAALANAKQREAEEAAEKEAAEEQAEAFNEAEAAIDEAEAEQKKAEQAAEEEEKEAQEERQAELVRDFREADDASMEDYKAYQAKQFHEADEESMADYAAYQAKKFKEADKESTSGASRSTASTETTGWWESTKEKITTLLDEKIIQPIQYFNYVMKSIPNPKGELFKGDRITDASSTLTLFGTVVDEKFLNGELNKFGKVIQTPINIISNSLSLLEGTGLQIINDMMRITLFQVQHLMQK